VLKLCVVQVVEVLDATIVRVCDTLVSGLDVRFKDPLTVPEAVEVLDCVVERV
jgi:hypothetical protein